MQVISTIIVVIRVEIKNQGGSATECFLSRECEISVAARREEFLQNSVELSARANAAHLRAPGSCDQLLVIDEALNQLEQADARAARVAELRFFAGLEENDIAENLGVSVATVKRDWKFARMAGAPPESLATPEEPPENEVVVGPAARPRKLPNRMNSRVTADVSQVSRSDRSNIQLFPFRLHALPLHKIESSLVQCHHKQIEGPHKIIKAPHPILVSELGLSS